MTGEPYEIRVVGALGPAAREAFAYLSVDVEPTSTGLSGRLDQPGLHAVLDQVRALAWSCWTSSRHRRHRPTTRVRARSPCAGEPGQLSQRRP